MLGYSLYINAIKRNDPNFLEDEFLLSHYSNIEYIDNLYIEEYTNFLKVARIKANDEKLYQRWLISGACNKYSFSDFKLALSGKETEADRQKRLNSLDI